MKASTEHRGVVGAQSVARAAALLRAVGMTRSHGSTLTQVASDVGLNVPTTRRLLQAMVAEGFLTFDRETKLYRVGPELVALASAGDQMFAERGLLAAAAQDGAVRPSARCGAAGGAGRRARRRRGGGGGGARPPQPPVGE